MFSAVVEEGGFSRAAERLNVSQSAVSQAIANLEHKLDAPLLTRGRSPELTEAGIRLFRFTQTVLNEEQNALADIRDIKSGALSTLSLAMNSMVNRFYAQELLLAFCEHNPLTRLKLDVAPSREIIYGVDEDRWELGFGPFQNRMPGHFQAYPYFTEQRVLVAHKAHPLFGELTASPERILGQTTLLTSFLDDSASTQSGGRIRDQFASVWEVSNLELRLALAASGMGVLYLSDRLLDGLLGYERIDAFDIGTIERRVGLYHKKHKALSEGARRFKAICEARFANPA